jgi:DNA mismatch endonuclease (patch repair protein)
LVAAVPVRPSAKDPKTALRLGGIRQRGTHPELLVRQAVRATGERYRLNESGLPGRPDLSNKSRGWVIFVHGCFWHHHERCARATIPKHNRTFWISKFTANQLRDTAALTALQSRGYQALVIWECQTNNPSWLKTRLDSFFLSINPRKSKR